MFPFETNQFENALESDQNENAYICNSVDDRKRIEMKTVTENITSAFSDVRVRTVENALKR